MQDLLKQIKDLKLKIKKTKEALNIESKKKNLKNLSDLMIQTDFWSDRKRAINISQEAENLKEEIESFENLAKALKDMEDLISLAQEYDDDSLKKDLDFRFRKILQDFSRLEFLLLFSDDLDNNNAIISIHAGTGGVDAQDFTEKLERLYLRWAEKKKFSVEIIDRSVASEAGIKSSVFKISGPYVYGRLKGENGVHRLVRISPFDAEKMRHTSFAGVEVIPELKDSEQVEIKDSDLKIDVFKSSGPGGQSVNTTDSAVRISHLPTKIVVTCQSERSQQQNKERALDILRAKLFQLKKMEKEERDREIKAGAGQGTWGKQIRSYVFQPYQMVKDHRNNFSLTDVAAVMDGDIDPFIEAYLRSQL